MKRDKRLEKLLRLSIKGKELETLLVTLGFEKRQGKGSHEDSSMKKNNNNKYQYKYLLNIRWSAEDNCYFGEFPELTGCATHGDSVEEVIENANDAVESWLDTAKEADIPIPEPVVTKKWSGTFTTRLDPDTHRRLAVKAKQKGKLLSKFIQEVLEQAVA